VHLPRDKVISLVAALRYQVFEAMNCSAMMPPHRLGTAHPGISNEA
jgi:hypothetical protein